MGSPGLLGGVGCGSDSSPSDFSLEDVPAGPQRLFVPPRDKTLLITGQDIDTIRNYVNDTAVTPSGVTSYVSADLTGVLTRINDSKGPLDLQSYINEFPDSVLAVGLWMVSTYRSIGSSSAQQQQVDRLISVLKNSNRPVLLRIGYEVDGSWNAYDPAFFKSAWEYIVYSIRKQQAYNISTVWQLAAYCGTLNNGIQNETTNTFRGLDYDAWYPGDDLVDWVGFSYFSQNNDCPGNNLPGGLPDGFGSLADVDNQGRSLALQNVVDYLKSKNKPIFIAEASPKFYWTGQKLYKPTTDPLINDVQSVTAQQIWDGWYEPFFSFVEQNRDSIRAVAYINMHWDSFPGWNCDLTNQAAIRQRQTCNDGVWGDARIQADNLIQTNWFARLNSGSYLYQEEAGLFSMLSDWDNINTSTTTSN